MLQAKQFYHLLRVSTTYKREFARVGAVAPQICLRSADAGNPPHDVLIERDGNKLVLAIEQETYRQFPRFIARKVCSYAYWLTLCAPEVKYITVNASDGEVMSNARFAASVRFPQHVGLPDPHFFENLGFASEQHAGKSAPLWADRSNDIVWRGGMNGCGWASFSPEDFDNPAVLQRLRMVMLLKNIAGVDVRIVNLYLSEEFYRPLILRQELLGSPMAERSWLNRKFAIDIDGFTNTWSNFLVRMLYGCCVLKVGSQFGFKQWYYDQIKPFEHYVPVRADMRDFAEKIEWVRSNDREAKAIAERGQALARTLTFANEQRRAAAIIEADLTGEL